jgi:uncharacterized protein YhfF
MSDAINRFWQTAGLAVPSLPASGYKVRTFGRGAEMSNTLVNLIAAGEKTGTFALDEEYQRDPTLRPAVGDFFVVIRHDRTPALVYQVTEVATVPFKGIGPEHVAVEGPNARDVKVWRAIHWPYWGAMLQDWGLTASEDMRVIFQRFRLVFVPPATTAD